MYSSYYTSRGRRPLVQIRILVFRCLIAAACFSSLKPVVVLRLQSVILLRVYSLFPLAACGVVFTCIKQAFELVKILKYQQYVKSFNIIKMLKY
jgi:hypothetical protein